jgi:hypothetical protein
MTTYRHVDHQFSLFTEAQMRPKMKVPISAERIKQLKLELDAGDGKSAARTLRAINDGLEVFARKKFGKNW